MSVDLSSISDPYSVITAFDCGLRFPETVNVMKERYESAIREFASLVASSSSSDELLLKIRAPKKSCSFSARMGMLKIFRRCVSGVCDTESLKKVRSIPTEVFVNNFGHTFKPISKLKDQFSDLNDSFITNLACLVGEYDDRGSQGYVLTVEFFNWFEDKFGSSFILEGQKGAGKDIEFSTLEPSFKGSCPCDFVIRARSDGALLAVGFARYDSTRGGSQSDDRTSANCEKVRLIKECCEVAGKSIRVLFLTDGPGLAHEDTWNESLKLDNSWNGNVRVTTVKLLEKKVTEDWISGKELELLSIIF